MGLDLNGLVDHLIDIGPYDELPPLIQRMTRTPPSAEEDTEGEESVGETSLWVERMS